MSRCERCDTHGPELPSIAADVLEMHRALHRPFHESLGSGLVAASTLAGIWLVGALLAGAAMNLIFT